jgi:hypothetical protein
MLPSSFELPAGVLLLLGGAVACFAGYRLFRVVLAIYGFIFGAMFVSSTMAPSNTAGMVAGSLVGGLVGAAVLVVAYFIGIALIGAGLGALLAHAGWQYLGTGDPPVAAVIVLAVLGAMGAMLLQRYVIVVSTAFGGAWTIVLGALTMNGDRPAGKPTSVSDAWILYPTTMPSQRWTLALWLLLGFLGTTVQLGITGRRRKAS